jgi:hypothetical protein
MNATMIENQLALQDKWFEPKFCMSVFSLVGI